MTIASIETKTLYSGNGSTAAFAIPFMFVQNQDIEVVICNTDGVETIQSLGTHYALTGAGEQTGGLCTMTTPPTEGTTLVIRRTPAIVQEVDYVENDAFPAATHEAALDKLTMICQTLSERLDRTITFRVSSAVSGVELPDPEQGKLLAWNDDASNLSNKELGSAEGILLPLAVDKGGTGGTNASEALVGLGFSSIGRAVALAEDSQTAATELGMGKAVLADKSTTLTAGYTAESKPMNTDGPTPATGALQAIDTTSGSVNLAVPTAAGAIRFIVTGPNGLNVSADYHSIAGAYDPGTGLAQGEIVSDGTNHFITIINRGA